jgi:hypothetical protein
MVIGTLLGVALSEPATRSGTCSSSPVAKLGGGTRLGTSSSEASASMLVVSECSDCEFLEFWGMTTCE